MAVKLRTSEDRASATSTIEAPSHVEIAVRAYAVYESRGGSNGRDLDDWLQAERELLAERTRDLLRAGPDDDDHSRNRPPERVEP